MNEIRTLQKEVRLLMEEGPGPDITRIQLQMDKILKREDKKKRIVNDLHFTNVEQAKAISELKNVIKEIQERVHEEAKRKCFSRLNINQNAIGNLFIVFDAKSNYIKTINIDDFGTLNKFEDYLRQEHLYAHDAYAFSNKKTNWYKLSLKDQLTDLGWKIGDNGRFEGLAW